jgi:D-amino-acid dehydrogenase
MAPYGYSDPEVLDGEGMRRFEPSLSRSVAAGFFLPQECYVDPVALTAALHRANVAEGVTIREAEAVIGFERAGTRVRSVMTNTGAYPVDDVVVAAGAWTGRFLERTLDLSLPIQAGKGYSFTVRPQRPPLRPLSLHEARVAVTPAGDRMRLAGTMEFSGLNDRIDPRRIAAISASASRFLEGGTPPERRDEWAGMRPLLPDGLPVIGRLRRSTNVVVATGHGMLGITQGAITGELVARHVAHVEVAPEFAAFAPSRFGA